jgi:transposase
MSWKEVAVAFGVSWDTVYAAVKKAVAYGLEHRSLGA